MVPSETTIEPNSAELVLPGARLSLILLLLINLFNYIDRYVLAAVQPGIAREFFKNAPGHAAQMGSLGSAFFLSYMLTAPIFGWLGDRISRWLLVGVGVLVWSLATGMSGFAWSFEVLFISRLFVGIGEAGYGPAAPTIISAMYPVSHRGAVLSWFYAAIPVGSALGYAIGGVVFAHFGWRSAFYAVTIPGLILGAWSLFMKEPTRDRPANSAKKGPGLNDYLQLLKNRSYIFNTLAMAAYTFAFGGIGFWAPTYLTQVRGIPDARAGLFFGGVTAAAGLTATLIGGWAGDRLRSVVRGAYFGVSGVAIIIGCPFIILMLHVPFPADWGIMFIAIFFLFFNTGPSNAALANVTHPQVRASAFALNIFFIHLFGDVTSPTVLGFVQDRAGWNATFGVVTMVMLLAGVLWIAGMRFLDEDTARASGGLVSAV